MRERDYINHHSIQMASWLTVARSRRLDGDRPGVRQALGKARFHADLLKLYRAEPLRRDPFKNYA